MSASITRSVIRKQFSAMGCELFEIGVLHQKGRMLLRRGWRTDQIDAAVDWLRRENTRGAHVFVRPRGTHALSLVDDLGVDGRPAWREGLGRSVNSRCASKFGNCRHSVDILAGDVSANRAAPGMPKGRGALRAGAARRVAARVDGIAPLPSPIP
jgi:hypothetical protein